jgi:hypothetical protein
MNVSFTANILASRYAKLICCLALFAALQSPGTTRADQPISSDPAAISPHGDIRYGGTLAESFAYHRQGGEARTIPAATGWYGYGFPVNTHRWGWFGAARYYPTVVWHRGYLGDQKRWAYRRGY